MSWPYVAAYVIGAVVSARIFYVIAFKVDYEDSQRKKVKGGEKKWLELAREYALFCSLGGLIWPVVWIVFGLITLIGRPTAIEVEIAEREKARKQEAAIETEMLRLRKWHEDNKMEPPDTNTLRFMAKENVKNV